ncbi:hypothetical protein [Pengzhenrongella sp.]|jgi:hypothetical protein|uniref:hypothetical protein n=1 Tax=Pengzhenrongella sp. TaxID=2888820 RepID=UPI002F937F6B
MMRRPTRIAATFPALMVLFALLGITLTAPAALGAAGISAGTSANPLGPPAVGAAAQTAAVTAATTTPFSFAVIGDNPYGSTALAAFPGRIGQLNADPDVQLVSHLGDISSPIDCSDGYYATIKSMFDTFVDPLVYTPGDNEWTDCHRAAVGQANPLERLGAVRNVFFPVPGLTLGQNAISVNAQYGYEENVTLSEAGLTFAAVHLVGSYNDLAAWTGLGYTTPTSAQLSEESARNSADKALIQSAFASAKADGSRAVVLLMQADMFTGSPGSTYKTAFKSIVQTISAESLAFARPVFLFNGDTHIFLMDHPLTTSKWLSFYGLTKSVPNLTRITIEGGSTLDEWAKVNEVSTSSVLQVQRVLFK